jgi:hypothetical protein
MAGTRSKSVIHRKKNEDISFFSNIVNADNLDIHMYFLIIDGFVSQWLK